MWHLLLLVGLAVSASGALILEEFRFECVDLTVLISGCVLSYQYEENPRVFGYLVDLGRYARSFFRRSASSKSSDPPAPVFSASTFRYVALHTFPVFRL